LSPGAVLDIKTQNHSYKIVYLGHGAAWISGHPQVCPQPRRVNILGSSCGGSTLKVDFIAEGTQLEFKEPGCAQATLTSPIEGIHVRRWGDSSLFRRALDWVGPRKRNPFNLRSEDRQTAVIIVENGLSAKRGSARSRSGARIAGSCRVLRQLLDKLLVNLVITEATLQDGNWCTVLRELAVRGSFAKVIVCSRQPNEMLRREALQRGASYAVGNPEIVATLFS
jgi:hypothetical protein